MNRIAVLPIVRLYDNCTINVYRTIYRTYEAWAPNPIVFRVRVRVCVCVRVRVRVRVHVDEGKNARFLSQRYDS